MTEIAVTASTDPGPSLPEPLLPELPLPALPLPEPPLPEPHTATELTPDADARLSPPGWPEEAAAHLAMPVPDLILAGPDDALRGALLDSRQRWRDLVMMTADFAFETDEWGRFVFVVPDPAIGWPTGTLVGQPWTLLIPDCMKGTTFNPFRCTIPVQRRRAWLRRGDGGMACVVFAAAPLLDASGRIVGTRGLGVDLTDHDQQDERVTAALRRGEVLDHILLRVGHEVLAPRMMRAALDGLANALGAEGCGVIVLPDGIRSARVLHESGHGAEATLETAAAMLDTGRGGTTASTTYNV